MSRGGKDVNKIKTTRDTKRLQSLKTRTITTRDVMSRQVTIKTSRNIRRGHIIRGMRDINHIEYESWEKTVSETLGAMEEYRFDTANRFYNVLSHIQNLLNEIRVNNEELQLTSEELEASSEELRSTNRRIASHQ